LTLYSQVIAQKWTSLIYASLQPEFFSVTKQNMLTPFFSSRGGNKKSGVHMISIYLFDLIKNE
jgi:hypothetical protein